MEAKKIPTQERAAWSSVSNEGDRSHPSAPEHDSGKLAASWFEPDPEGGEFRRDAALRAPCKKGGVVGGIGPNGIDPRGIDLAD